jgi:hypothetical protein
MKGQGSAMALLFFMIIFYDSHVQIRSWDILICLLYNYDRLFVVKSHLSKFS